MARLKSLVRKRRKSVLSSIVDFFSKGDYSAYLVGGVVRDLLLNRGFVDIDIVVEEGLENVARLLNQNLSGELTMHKEFKTASIITKDTRIDFVQARKEFYPEPGSLPRVAPGTIIDDLVRRDFTINAIAIGISKDNWGKVLDPSCGLKDIETETIRILHKNSFRDDPTRIFRALRYKNRLHFKLERTTTQLLKKAVLYGFISNISEQRILNEIKLIFMERSFKETVQDLVRYNIYKLSVKDIKILLRLASLKYYYFLSKINHTNFPLKKKEMKIIKDLNELNETKNNLKKAELNSEIYNILAPICDEVVDVIPSLYPSLRKKINRYLSLKKINPLISGEDLKLIGIPPGPGFRSLLRKAFELQIDRGINSKEILLKEMKKWQTGLLN